MIHAGMALVLLPFDFSPCRLRGQALEGSNEIK